MLNEGLPRLPRFTLVNRKVPTVPIDYSDRQQADVTVMISLSCCLGYQQWNRMMMRLDCNQILVNEPASFP